MFYMHVILLSWNSFYAYTPKTVVQLSLVVLYASFSFDMMCNEFQDLFRFGHRGIYILYIERTNFYTL